MLVLLFRNILRLYVGQSGSALGARLRTRMVMGAALIALTPAVFMFLFSIESMNRSIDRWFSPNTTELREDSTRVVRELVQYVTSNARGEAESIAGSGAPDRDPPCLQDALVSHRVTLDGGFVLVFGNDRECWPALKLPRSRAQLTCFPGWTKASGEPRSASTGHSQECCYWQPGATMRR